MKTTNFIYKYGVIIAIIGLLVIFSGLLPGQFLTFDNLMNIMTSITITTLVAGGVTFSLVVGGFDLSVGSVASLASMLAAGMMVFSVQPAWVAILVPLIAGILIGLSNSFLSIKLRIPDLLATLGMMYVARGIQLVYCRGNQIFSKMNIITPHGIHQAPGTITKDFLFIGQGKISGIPFMIILMLVIIVIGHIILNNTKLGRLMYATGGNPEAARLSGIDVAGIKTIGYILSGVLAAIGGIVLASYLGSGQPNAGDAYLMDAVAASFIGFTFLGIGIPNLPGTLIGAIFTGVLMNGLTMMNVPYTAQDIFKGLVLVGALALRAFKNK